MNAKVKIGLIGVTGRGEIAKSWQEMPERSEIVAGMDISDEALEIFKDHINPDAFTTTNVDELLQRDDIDAIAVTSPDFTHEEYVVKAFKAGKHVFCEKPMAITTEGCDRMLKAWQASGKQFMIGFNMRYMNVFRVMKDIVDSGIIGDVKVVWCRHFVGRGGEWYYHDWHANSKNSTGLLLQKAAHDIDMIHWITGKYSEKVVGMGSLDYYGGDKPDDLRCSSCVDSEDCVEFQKTKETKANKMDMCVFRNEVDVEDNSTIIMNLEGGIQATYMQCHYTADYCRNYTFIGTEGRVENSDGSNIIVKLKNKSKRWKNLADQSYEVKPAEGTHGGADPIICKDFIDMIQKGIRPIATPLAGRMSVATACAGTESIRNNSSLTTVPDLPANLNDGIF
jgi:predicted dehydrogenase